MFNCDFSFEEFVLVAQSLLTRIDYISELMPTLEDGSIVKHTYMEELLSLKVLYDKLTHK